MSADRVVFSPLALAELEELTEYIAERNPDAAERVRASVLALVEQLALPAPRLDGPPTVLRTGVTCFRDFVHPVTVFYRRAPGRLDVVRIYHHAREPIAR